MLAAQSGNLSQEEATMRLRALRRSSVPLSRFEVP
jgi:hypothetical protein